MRQFLFVLLALVAGVSHASSEFALPNPRGPYGVGLHIVQQYDYSRAFKEKVDILTGQPAKGERARPIQTIIWYPAQKGGKPVTYRDYVLTESTEEKFDLAPAEIKKIFDLTITNEKYYGLNDDQMEKALNHQMAAVKDAAPLHEKFPLVIYAPSFGASAQENVDLCELLASQGYVVIASPSVGQNTRAMTKDLEGIEAQAADIEFLISYAKSIPEVDNAHIAVVGYSWGGLSNLFAAAKDSRISALVDFDGSMRYFGQFVNGGKDSAHYVTPDKVTIPILFIAQKPIPIETLITMSKNGNDVSYSFFDEMKYSDTYFVTLQNMSHGYFSEDFLHFASEDYFEEDSREEIIQAHGEAAHYVSQFLNAYLKNNAGSMNFMKTPLDKKTLLTHLITKKVHLSEGAPPTLESFAVELGNHHFENAYAIYQDFHKKNPSFEMSARTLDYWGYQFINTGKNREGIEIFKMATELYPNDANAFDSLADAYEINGEKASAIKNYQRSIEISPNDFAKKRLQNLGVTQ